MDRSRRDASDATRLPSVSSSRALERRPNLASREIASRRVASPRRFDRASLCRVVARVDVPRVDAAAAAGRFERRPRDRDGAGDLVLKRS
jgi:hypothetical protein